MWAPNIVLTVLGVIGLHPGEPGVGLHPRRRLPGGARRHPAPLAPGPRPLGRRRRGRRMKAMSTPRPLRPRQLGPDLRADRARLPDRLDPDQPDRHAEPAARPRTHDEGDRLELRLLHPGEHVPGDAGGGPLRHRVHRRRDGPALRAHRGQGRGAELPPADAAHLRRGGGAPRCSRSWWASWRPAPPRSSSSCRRPRQARPTRARFNFVYRGDVGWVYTIRSLDVANRQLKQLMFERQGTGADYPGLVITADSASYDQKSRGWRVRQRRQPGDRRARRSRPCSPSRPCGSGP